jgi:hypothetical protein
MDLTIPVQRYSQYCTKNMTIRSIICKNTYLNWYSSDKFYVGDALQMIEALVNQGLLIKDSDSLLSLPS